MENGKHKFADQTWLNTHSEVMEVGGGTTVSTIARIAAVKLIAQKCRSGALKEGDQVEWTATLNGRLTIDEAMLGDAINELIR